MNDLISNFYDFLVSAGLSETHVLIFLIFDFILIFLLIWKFIIKPIKDRYDKLQESIDNQKEFYISINQSIEKLEYNINNVLESNSERYHIQKYQADVIQQDLQNIKQNLAHFQGALSHNSRLFDNKELR